MNKLINTKELPVYKSREFRNVTLLHKAVSHDVLYYTQLSIARYQVKYCVVLCLPEY